MKICFLNENKMLQSIYATLDAIVAIFINHNGALKMLNVI